MSELSVTVVPLITLVIVPADRVDEARAAIVRGCGSVEKSIIVGPELAARITKACAEIGREVGYRRACYPRWVTQKKMSQEKADEQIAALEDAATLLRELSGVKR